MFALQRLLWLWLQLGDDVAFTLVEVDVFAVSPNFDGDFDAC